MSYKHKERVLQSLRQIENSILLLQEWNAGLKSADDYLLSPEGMKNLAASCMLVEAIGEAYKKIDVMTDGALLPLFPSVPIDADVIYETVKNDLGPLLDATRFFLEEVAK